MSEHPNGAPEAQGASGEGGTAPGPALQPTAATAARAHPSLTTQVRRRRADQAFFLRLRDTIQQNQRALERLGT